MKAHEGRRVVLSAPAHSPPTARTTAPRVPWVSLGR
jgi:hypothetical protein